ncbi:hypothetical protein H072_11235 [Dactylellina haptotyla CBS 200.50]|uniref:Uncharacterized protein n=1 Tax=Dactylellina haptotyla (strain CBS 200.50) TaxID=1284197 RepID=S8BJJ3_DACHA|nr:hypothetical protein H072_11235 [Dactylellina haptotyla CBS 200.50]
MNQGNLASKGLIRMQTTNGPPLRRYPVDREDARSGYYLPESEMGPVIGIPIAPFNSKPELSKRFPQPTAWDQSRAVLNKEVHAYESRQLNKMFDEDDIEYPVVSITEIYTYGPLSPIHSSTDEESTGSQRNYLDVQSPNDPYPKGYSDISTPNDLLSSGGSSSSKHSGFSPSSQLSPISPLTLTPTDENQLSPIIQKPASPSRKPSSKRFAANLAIAIENAVPSIAMSSTMLPPSQGTATGAPKESPTNDRGQRLVPPYLTLPRPVCSQKPPKFIFVLHIIHTTQEGSTHETRCFHSPQLLKIRALAAASSFAKKMNIIPNPIVVAAIDTKKTGWQRKIYQATIPVAVDEGHEATHFPEGPGAGGIGGGTLTGHSRVVGLEFKRLDMVHEYLRGKYLTSSGHHGSVKSQRVNCQADLEHEWQWWADIEQLHY